MKWISVEDKLPPVTGHYLVWVPEWEGYGNYPTVDICYWSRGAFTMGVFASVDDGAPVTHWMELPEGP